MKRSSLTHRRLARVSNLLWISSWTAAASHASAQDAMRTLETMVVTAESEADETAQEPWLAAVSGTSIHAGKKTAVLDFDQRPRIIGNNYRQALERTPGLLLAEESTPLVSIGYRGLNPHRAMFTQILRDGIPIHADQFGYPEAYYTPPLDTVDRIEFLHGGAALQFGPQPGGALNYITHRPRTDREFSFRSQQIGGSDGLYSTFTSADGTVGSLGYYTYFNHRQGDGFRSANSDYNLNNGAVKCVWSLGNFGTLIINADRYQETHGEPGGLSVSDFNAGSLHATRLHDEMTIERDSVSLTHEIELGADAFAVTNLWWSNYQRFSKRQAGGGFGTLATGTTNAIELQEFNALGLDSRYRIHWGGEKQHTLTSGFQAYHMDSPRTDSTGATVDAESGTINRISDRQVLYLPLFVENHFKFGKFSVTPGLRLETFDQEVRTRFQSPAAADRARDVSDQILLAGIGSEFEVSPQGAVYANVSQSYRPVMFAEAVPTGNGQVVNGDLEEGKAVEYELGYRSKPIEGVTLDASVFLLSFEDQIGTQGTTTANVGDASHRGLDLMASADFFEIANAPDPFGALTAHLAATLLDAEFTAGPNQGKSPQYAPDYLIRSGLTWQSTQSTKVTLSGTFVDGHFANDTNTSNFRVPGYMVWDLTAECKVHEHLRILAGINNLLNESYFTRVRNDGIDPSNGRNYYVGCALEF